VLIEGPALTAQGKTRPFLSYYDFVLDAVPMQETVAVRRQFFAHVIVMYAEYIPLSTRQFSCLGRGAAWL